MDLPKALETQLMPLEDLSRRVEHFAELCCPDFVYDENDTHNMAFVELDLDAMFGDEPGLTTTGIAWTGIYATLNHTFTDWSRSQLLSHVGVQKKWFWHVSRQHEVQELNRRIGTLRGHVIRTMKSEDLPSLRFVRGFVSSRYADIPDTSIMQAVTPLMPDGQCLRRYSGKTDRAFYAYVVAGDPIGIPGTSFRGFPGMVIKNSEVGYTALWVTPTLFLGLNDGSAWVPAILERSALLRRIHRGSAEDLAAAFKTALEKSSNVWGPMQSKLNGLGSVHYPDEDNAVAALRALMNEVKATKGFAYRCEQLYRAAHHRVHDGVKLFDAVLGAIHEEANQDTAYLMASVAGAVLLKLLS